MQGEPAGSLLPPEPHGLECVGRDNAVDPPYDYPDYRSTEHRAPKRPLLPLPRAATDLVGPLLGEDRIGPLDNDLTRLFTGDDAVAFRYSDGAALHMRKDHEEVIERDGDRLPASIARLPLARAGRMNIGAGTSLRSSSRFES